MTTFAHLLIFVGILAIVIALLAAIFIGLCIGLDRWIGVMDVRREDDEEQASTVSEQSP